MRSNLLPILTGLALALSAAPALAQDPAEPEPIPDFWSAEESAATNASAPAPAGSPAAGPSGAPSGAATGAPSASPCHPRALLAQAEAGTRAALRGRPLVTRSGRALAVRLTPCISGRLELRVVDARTAAVLAAARGDLVRGRAATLRLAATATGRRAASRRTRRPVRLRLVAVFRPAE
jgi:hypothetical protein